MSTIAPARPARLATIGRVGLVIAAILAASDLVGGVMSLIVTGEQSLPLPVAVFVLAAGAATLVLLPIAWRGVRPAIIALIVIRLLSALTAVPAFLVPGVPAGMVVLASVGILVTVAAAALVVLGMRARG